MTSHLLLIGARASGKSSIGRQVAERLGLPFIDLDDEVLASFAEPTVKAVWEAHSEATWRAAEALALDHCLDREKPAVIATGGGTVMIESARAAIDAGRASGKIVVAYLQVPAAVLVERLTAAEGDRPSLTGEGVAAEVDAVLAARRPTYEAMADLVVDGALGTARVVAAILAGLDGGLDGTGQ